MNDGIYDANLISLYENDFAIQSQIDEIFKP